jgi:hypothetical protein
MDFFGSYMSLHDLLSHLYQQNLGISIFCNFFIGSNQFLSLFFWTDFAVNILYADDAAAKLKVGHWVSSFCL